MVFVKNKNILINFLKFIYKNQNIDIQENQKYIVWVYSMVIYLYIYKRDYREYAIKKNIFTEKKEKKGGDGSEHLF